MYSAALTRRSAGRNLKWYSRDSPPDSKCRSSSGRPAAAGDAASESYTVAATAQRFCSAGVMPVSSSSVLASYPLAASAGMSLAS
jgi:hypothetical protein